MKVLTLIFLLVQLLQAMQCVSAQEKILNIYTWAGYLPPDVIRQFEQKTGVRINHSTYVNNESLYAKLKANPEAGYDIVLPSSYFIKRLIRHDLIQPVDKRKLKNLKNLNKHFLNQNYDPDNKYTIPYLWNLTGIVLNTKSHSLSKLKSWSDLWRPNYRDELLVLDDTREIFSIALLKLGYSVNDTDPQHIHQAFEQLKLLMPNVKLFNLDAQRSIYLDEDITLGMGWSGDVYLAKQENSSLEFVAPKEGTIIALDCLVIPKGAKHVDLAHLFIDFILQPSIAKEISMSTGFSTTNSAAVQLLPESLKRNKTLYPPIEVLKKSQMLDDVGEAAKLYEQYFERLKLEQ